MSIRCLIVDDNESFMEIAGALLKREGLTVVGVTSTSADALRKVANLRPDVVLVDIFLGEESGLELARQLTNGGPDVSATVILISTHAQSDLEDLIAGSPAAGFLPKAELSAKAVLEIVEGRSNDGAVGRRGR